MRPLLAASHLLHVYCFVSLFLRSSSACRVLSVTPSLMREASYSSIRMGLYDYFRGVVAPAGTRKEDFTLLHKIAAGVCSGALGSSLATPLDLMKIRFQSYSLVNPNPYRNTLRAFIETVRKIGHCWVVQGSRTDHCPRRYTKQLVSVILRPQQGVAHPHWTVD